MSKHTPTPWEVYPGDPRDSAPWFAGRTLCAPTSDIPGDNGRMAVAHTNFHTEELARANAAFIVRAVNSHETLISALKLIAGHDGLTLLGPVSDTERFHASGAAKAFADMAEIARDALDALAAEKEEAA